MPRHGVQSASVWGLEQQPHASSRPLLQHLLTWDLMFTMSQIAPCVSLASPWPTLCSWHDLRVYIHWLISFYLPSWPACKLRELWGFVCVCVCVCVCVFGLRHMACVILVPWLGIDPAPLALAGRALITGSPGKSPGTLLCLLLCFKCLKQCLSPSKCSVNVWWLNERTVRLA